MKLLHVPGPWAVLPPSATGGLGWCVARGGRILAAIKGEVGKPHTRAARDEKEATARLMAAAPELLGTLRFCLSVIRSNHPAEASEFEAIDRIEAAIAAATKGGAA